MSPNTRKIKINSEVLLKHYNPVYRELQNKYIHLEDLQHAPNSELPVRVILGISHFTKIKTQERPRVGLPGEPIAELSLGGLLFLLNKKLELQMCYFSKTYLHDYETLCSLDSLGL